MAHREARKGGKGTGPGPSNNALRVPADAAKSPEALTKLAYKHSLETGVSIDTRFFAYSRRKPDGTVFAPRAVYANSWILRTKLSSYFEPLLRGGYKTTFDALDSQFPTEFKSETDEYDYGSDSDIDGDEEGDEGTLKSAYVPKKPAAKKADDALKDETKQIHTLGRGQTLLMGNFAFSTWKAFIFYLCVGEVNFSQLKSQASASATPAAATRKNLSSVAPPCSPKSMYRLADELGFDELKKKAIDDIKSKLTADNILAELFSTITSRYEDIQDLEIDYACTTASLRTVVSTNIVSYVSGMGSEDQARNAELMSRFIAKLMRNTPSTGTLQPASGHYCISCGPSNLLCANFRDSTSLFPGNWQRVPASLS